MDLNSRDITRNGCRQALLACCLGAVALLVNAVFAATGKAGDWPRYLGPNQNGTAEQSGLIREFPDGGPPVLWTVEIGPGYGGAAIREGEVYLHDRLTGEADRLRVFDLYSGEELWTFESEAVGRLQFAGSRCVPTVTEDLIYLQGGLGHLFCLDRETQETVWSVSFTEEYESEDPGYGWCQAPLIYEDLVISAPLADDVGLIAYDRFTGAEVWSTGGLGMTHSTPVLVELFDEPQILFITARRLQRSASERNRTGLPPVETWLSGFCPEDGELLWRTEKYHSSYPIPVPVKSGESELFLTSGYAAGSSLLALNKDDGEVSVEVKFHHPKGSQIHAPIRVGEFIYVLANENDNDPRPRRKEGGLMCLDLSGNEMWRTGEDPYFGRGSMIHADRLLIIQDGYNGVLRLVEPNPEAYTPIAEANIFEVEDRRDHGMWAPLALANGLLVMRSQEQMKCVDLRAGGSP